MAFPIGLTQLRLEDLARAREGEGGCLERDAAGAFERITEDYLAERFGKMPSPDLNAELAILEHAIGRMGLRNQADVG